MAWRRIQSCGFTGSETNAYLKEGYRKHTIESAVHEVNIRDVFQRLRAVDIEPILFKGWALARLYPEAGLRPYGDIDLWVSAQDLESLNRALFLNGNPGYCVEPHGSFYPQYARSLEDVMSRSQLVNLDGLQVRIPCDEDHLRFICLHFLFHGGWRPLWLCDIALMVEAADSSFDWDSCLRGNRKHADWIACAIGLAHELLGAEIRGTPVESRAKTLPRWLAAAVLRQWEQSTGMSSAQHLSLSLLQPAALARAVREHWRNPIQASVEMNAWFNESPRGPLQFGSALKRIPQVFGLRS
jgi:hypothetical protein